MSMSKSFVVTVSDCKIVISPLQRRMLSSAFLRQESEFTLTVEDCRGLFATWECRPPATLL